VETAALTTAAVATAKVLPTNAIAQAIQPSPSTPKFTDFVDVLIGTGGHGHTYPGATVPFGMVQLSPDTWNGDWDLVPAITSAIRQ